MSLLYNTDDVHIERRLSAGQREGRAFFINVRPPPVDDNGRTQSEHQAANFIRSRNNLNISPGERGREAFTKTPTKVRDNAMLEHGKGAKIEEEDEKLCHYIRIMQIPNNILPEYNF